MEIKHKITKVKASLAALTVVATLFLGCAKEEPKQLPSVLLTESQMIDVMTDVQVMEASLDYLKTQGKPTYKFKTIGYESIFNHYGITDSIYFENLNYYNENPEVMVSIVDSVMKHITTIDKKIFEERPDGDSQQTDVVFIKWPLYAPYAGVQFRFLPESWGKPAEADSLHLEHGTHNN